MPTFVLTVAEGDKPPERATLTIKSKEACRRAIVDHAIERLAAMRSNIFARDLEITLASETGRTMLSFELVAVEHRAKPRSHKRAA